MKGGSLSLSQNEYPLQIQNTTFNPIMIVNDDHRIILSMENLIEIVIKYTF